jgi:hypothetical protein
METQFVMPVLRFEAHMEQEIFFSGRRSSFNVVPGMTYWRGCLEGPFHNVRRECQY